MQHYVYGIFENENGEPFYIGKGSGYRSTATLYMDSASFLKKAKLEKLKESGIKPVVKILEYFETSEEALVFERMLISFYGKKIDNTGILTNLSDGGEATEGWIPSEETRRLWSQQRAGTIQSEDHIAKRVAANTGKRRNEEQKRNQRLGAIRRRKEEVIPIIEAIESSLPYSRGMYQRIADDLGVDKERVSRVYKDLDLYKEAIYGS